MKIKTFCLYDDSMNVIDVFEDVQSVKYIGNSEQNIDIKIDSDTVKLRGMKAKHILIEDEVEIGDVLTDELLEKSIDIEHEISDKDEIKEIKGQLKEATKVINEVSRQFIKSDNLSDEQKSELIGQFRNIKVGDTVHPNEVVRIQGGLYKMIQSSDITIHDESWLTDESIFTDFINPVLQEDGEDQVIVDDYVQPTGAHDAYNTGDAVLFNGEIYIALQDGLVWSPADFPQGWELSE